MVCGLRSHVLSEYVYVCTASVNANVLASGLI